MVFNEEEEDVMEKEEGQENNDLQEFVSYAKNKDIKALILLIRDLNTNSRNSWLAQRLLKELLLKININKVEDVFNQLK